MILSRPDLLEAIKTGALRIEPPVGADQIAQVSIDLKLGRKFVRFRTPPGYIHAINVDHSLWDSADLWERIEAEEYHLQPNNFVLAQTLESVCIPPNLVGLVQGRSSWARVGVSIHVTAPKIDPGFNAQITLEMFNFGRVPVNLRAGIDKPAQLMLLRVTTPLGDSELYGKGPEDKFQGQTSPIPHQHPDSSS